MVKICAIYTKIMKRREMGKRSGKEYPRESEMAKKYISL